LDATVLGIVLLGGSMFALGFLLCLAMIFVHSDEEPG
jgi:hypothetical protein